MAPFTCFGTRAFGERSLELMVGNERFLSKINQFISFQIIPDLTADNIRQDYRGNLKLILIQFRTIQISNFLTFQIWVSISLTQVTILMEKISSCSDANFTNVERRIWMP